MGRVLGLPLLIVALVAGVYVFAKQVRHHEPTAPPLVQDTSQAQGAVAATNLQSAASGMQAWFAANGTYAGATLPEGTSVILVRADATSYCLETGDASAVEHELGPNGSPQPGPC
jgi:hypothetical protein